MKPFTGRSLVALAATLATLSLALPACGGGGGPSEDPSAVARGVLEAYKAQDVDGIMKHLPEAARNEEVPPADKIFREGNWRTDTTKAWDGELGAVRVNGDDARVAYAEADGETFAVSLVMIDGKWHFKSLVSPSTSDFEAWGEAK